MTMLDSLRSLAPGKALLVGLALSIAAGPLPAKAVVETVRQETFGSGTFESHFRRGGKRDRTDYQFGGWIGFTAASIDNEDNSDATPDLIDSIVLQDLRLWSRVWLRDGSTAYVRLRAIGYNFGMAPGVTDPDLPNEGVDVDLAYLDTRLFGIDHRIGRQFVRYGSGVVLNNTLDAIRSYTRRGNFTVNSLFGKNKPNEVDLDPNVGSPHRIFTGYDAYYQRHDGHKFFGYFLAERDKSGQPNGVTQAAQGFHYDANYFALGSDGRVTPAIDYHLEGIYQTGDSYAVGAGGLNTNDISAFAGVASATHHRNVPTHPVYSVEYLFGSGDAGRLPGLGTQTGNLPGAGDDAFLGFGRYDLGIALNPRLSNLHVLRLGASVRPWEEHEGFEGLTLGGKLSYYRKDDAAGGISDPQATVADEEVGTGLDLYMGWRIYSDLAWLVRYGHFAPGNAYPVATADATDLVYSNVTYSF